MWFIRLKAEQRSCGARAVSSLCDRNTLAHGYGVLDVVIEAILILLIVLPPLALGSVAPWAQRILFVCSAALLSAWGLRCAWSGSIRFIKTLLWLFPIVFLLIAVAQVIPLPHQTMRTISPGTYETYSHVFQPASVEGRRWTLSLSPYHTKVATTRFLMLFLIFFVVVNYLRKTWQAMGLVIAMLFIGSFEVLYGFAQKLSGDPHIFWIPRLYNLDAVAGTFHNKNHFAGLLEMTFPAGLGLLLSMRASGVGMRRERQPCGVGARVALDGHLGSLRTYAMILVGSVCVLQALGILFSLSRAGIFSAVIAILCFFAFAGTMSGFRRNAVLLLVVVAAIFALAISIGVQIVIEVSQDAVRGQSTSWLDRVDLSKSALRYIKDYWVLGSGFGTFGVVFPRYQSGRFGDQWADFLHNDALQAVCEMGIVAGGFFLVGILLIFLSAVSNLLRRGPLTWRWVGIGCAVGVLGMLIHSLFDYNLGKINSNAILFTVLLGIAFVASRSAEQAGNQGSAVRADEIILSSRLCRLVIGVLSVGVFLGSIWVPIGSVKADIHFNKHLSLASTPGRANDYFFLDVAGERGKGGDDLDKALSLDGSNPEYWYWKGRSWLEAADEVVRQRANQEAERVLGISEDGGTGSGPSKFDMEALARNLVIAMKDDRRPYLLRALECLEKACRLCPTWPEYRAWLGAVVLELEGPSARAVEAARVATWLAPWKPAVQFMAGRVLLALAAAEQAADARDETFGEAKECFRRAIYGEPLYARRVYPLVSSLGEGASRVWEITPKTLAGYEGLCAWFEEQRDWADFLMCLDRFEGLMATGAGRSGRSWNLVGDSITGVNGADESLVPLKGARGYEGRPKRKIAIGLLKKRCLGLAVLQRWSERTEQVIRYRKLIRDEVEPFVKDASWLEQTGRVWEAVGLCKQSLDRDWGNPQALLGMAECIQVSSDVAGSVGDSWLDYLYRLVICNENLNEELAGRCLRTLERGRVRNPREEVIAEFVRGALYLRWGQAQKAVEVLAAVGSRSEESLKNWRQYHQIWYFLGLAYEAIGEMDMAGLAYRKVVSIVPTHGEALARLSNLNESVGGVDEKVDERLASIRPHVPCNIIFGGKVAFLGYTLRRGDPARRENTQADQEGDEWWISYYWQFIDSMRPEYYPAVHFCDRGMKILFQDDHRIGTGQGVYPVDFPRTGEVVVETRRLVRSPMDAVYLRIGVWMEKPIKQEPQWLPEETGQKWVYFLILPEGRGSQGVVLAKQN